MSAHVAIHEPPQRGGRVGVGRCDTGMDHVLGSAPVEGEIGGAAQEHRRLRDEGGARGVPGVELANERAVGDLRRPGDPERFRRATQPRERAGVGRGQRAKHFSAKAYVSGAAAASALCRLAAATDTDNSLGNGIQFTLTNLVVHEFAAAGVVDYQCSTGGTQAASQIRIVAIRVGNLTAG